MLRIGRSNWNHHASLFTQLIDEGGRNLRSSSRNHNTVIGREISQPLGTVTYHHGNIMFPEPRKCLYSRPRQPAWPPKAVSCSRQSSNHPSNVAGPCADLEDLRRRLQLQ